MKYCIWRKRRKSTWLEKKWGNGSMVDSEFVYGLFWSISSDVERKTDLACS